MGRFSRINGRVKPMSIEHAGHQLKLSRRKPGQASETGEAVALVAQVGTVSAIQKIIR